MIRSLSVSAAINWIKERSPIVVDARDPAAFRNGHLPNALPLNLSTVTSVIRKLSRNRTVLVYDHGTEVNRGCTGLFEELGFTDVYRLEGGYEAWCAADGEIERPPNFHADVRCDPLTLWLMERGGDPDDVNASLPDGTPPLIQASRLGLPKICAELIRAGARLSATDVKGNDALWAACESGDLATVRALVEAGISLNRRNGNGITSLAFAAIKGKADLVAFLLEAGADPNIRDKENLTAQTLASTPEVQRLFRQPGRTGALAKTR